MAPLGFVGRMVTKTAVGRAADELAERLADQTEAAIDTAVRLRAPALAAGVEIERRLYPDLAPDLFLAHLVRRRAKLSAAVFPGAGTVVGIGSSLADAGATLYAEVALIVELSAAVGHKVDDPEVLAADVLVVLALSAGVEIPAELREASRLGTAQASAVPRAALGDLNRELGARVVKRIARRRARVILGRELPFGVGVALGGVGNYRAMHALGRTAIKHLKQK
jgi:hypothetical protein